MYLAGLFVVLALCFGASSLLAQGQTSAHESLRAGDEAFRRKDFAAAELHYRRAEERAPSFQSAYNLGVTLGYLARSAEAALFFEQARERSRASEDRGDASYNAGTARLEEKELQASVKDYAQALQANPRDDEARQNLSHALRQLRRQEQQQRQQPQQGGNKQPPPPPQDQQQNQQEPQRNDAQPESDEQSPQQPSPESQQPEQDRQEGDDAGESDGEQPEEPQDPTDSNAGKGKKPLPADEAERLLQIAADQEKRTNEKMRFGESPTFKPAKDW